MIAIKKPTGQWVAKQKGSVVSAVIASTRQAASKRCTQLFFGAKE